MPIPQENFFCGTGILPVPQKTFFLVEQASCLLQNLIKMNFARGLIDKIAKILKHLEIIGVNLCLSALNLHSIDRNLIQFHL